MADRDRCSSGCLRPPEPSWFARSFWQFWVLVTWPVTVRELKRAGFRRTGWMTWESGPDGRRNLNG